MVSSRRLLLLATRVVPGIIFVDVIRSATMLMPKLISELATLTHLSIELLLVSASGVLAIVTVVSGSITAYAATLVALILTKLPVSQHGLSVVSQATTSSTLDSVASHGGIAEIPWVGIAGFFLLLAVDSYATAFRPSTLGRLSVRVIARSVATFLTLSAPFLVTSAVLGIYFSAIVGFLRAFPSKLEFGPLRILSASYIVYIAITTIAFFTLIKLLNSVAELVTLFTVSSKKLSLKALLDESDLNKVFSPPIAGTLLGLAILSFYPAIHTLLFEVVFKPLREVITGAEVPASIILNIISFLATSFIFFGSVGKSMIFSHRRGPIPAVFVFSLVYASAVKLSLQRGLDLLSSLIRPDFGGVIELVGKSYLNYAYYLLTFLESLLGLLGATP